MPKNPLPGLDAHVKHRKRQKYYNRDRRAGKGLQPRENRDGVWPDETKNRTVG